MHAAFPSGHALQSFLIAACVSEALPTDNTANDLKAALHALADRIGENREVAGVHYPSDREASRAIAPVVMKALHDKSPMYNGLLTRARMEWQRS